MTNEQLVKKMMNSSETGVLKQAFIIEAIYHYSELVINQMEESEKSLIKSSAWKQCAKECIDEIDGRK
jgi:hypothetical protein